MSTRYDERNYDRGDDRSRRRSEYGQSYRGRSEGRYRYDDSDRESGQYGSEGEYRSGYSGRMSGRDRERRYDDEYTGRSSYGGSRESRPRDDYSGRSSYSGDDEYTNKTSSSRREPYRSEGYGYDRWENEGGHVSSRDRAYGGFGRYGEEGGYGLSSSEYSQRYNYPQSRRRESHGDRSGREYQGGQYWRGQQRGYEGERGRGYGDEEERGWWDRTSDEIASWFGDREAERRRQMDRQREFRGRGPKGYRRSDERIKEDVNDRLSEGYLDATEIEVLVVNSEVTLTGTVNTRDDKRLAEDIAESVSGVSNVENRLRVTQSSLDRPLLGTETSAGRQTTGTSGSMNATGSTGITGSPSSTGTTGSSTTSGTTGRGKSAGT